MAYIITLWDTIDIIILIVFAEAIVELWKNAAPIAPIKEWLVLHTPFLYSTRQGTHLLMCPYCLSLYAGFAAISLYSCMGYAPVRWVVYALAIHRLSNWTHLIFSLVADAQRDRRIARNKSRG